MFGFLRSAARRVIDSVRSSIVSGPYAIKDPYLVQLFGGGNPSASGTIVTQETAMRLNAVYCCVKVIANGVAQLPLNVYERQEPKGKKEALNHPLWRVLHEAPNPLMSSFTFRQTMSAWYARTHNAYAEKVYDKGGRLVELWPIPTPLVQPIITDKLEMFYDVTVPGVGRRQRLSRDQVFHWVGFSSDGLVGMDPIALHRETIGLGLAVEGSAGRYFGNGSQPGGVIEVDGVLGPDKKKELKAAWERAHSGLENSYRVAVLERGSKWHQIALSPEDSQLLESRRYGRKEIAAIFDVPLHRIMDIENASYATVEQEDINFAVHCLAPILESFEAALSLQVFSERDRAKYFAKHRMNGLMRGSFKDRMEGWRTMWNMGAACADDIRESEDMNPLEGERGASVFVPLNMVAVPEGGLEGFSAKPMSVEPGETSPGETSPGDGSKPAPAPALPKKPADREAP